MIDKQTYARQISHLPIMDLSAECTDPASFSSMAMCWTRPQLDRNWQLEFDQTAQDQIRQTADLIIKNPVQCFQRDVDSLDWPAVLQAVERLRLLLDQNPGFGVLRSLPLDDYPEEVMVEVYWLIGKILARPVAQKWNGQMIYSVKDFGKRYQYGTRGSHTSVELVFHTDNAFGNQVPDYVGLLCMRPAAKGGTSRFCSLYTVHQRLEQHNPDALKRLYQPMLFDRQNEHAEGAPKVCSAPFFTQHNGKLRARANTSLVKKGYELVQLEPDPSLLSALQNLDDICTDEDLWCEAPLQRGDVQYLNNHEVAHYRSEFEDAEDDAYKRHLYRLWHRDTGSVSYDG